MAEACISVAPDHFGCPICLDLLTNPVALSCGHSFCMSCITDCWNQEDQKGVYSCPQCRQTFTPRPALRKNTILAEMVERLAKTTLQPATLAQCYAGPGDVECDFCTVRKLKAVKSCKMCLNSYCQIHLEQHENFFKDRKHQLMEPTGRLQEMICEKHGRPLEVFCQNDKKCICMMCLLDEHKNHNTITAAAERIDKQKQAKEEQRRHKEEIQQKEELLQELRNAVDSYKRSTQAIVEDSERSFTELIHTIERRRSEVTQLIRDQEKAAVSRAEGFMKSLMQTINVLKNRDAELEQLSHTDDILYLQCICQPFIYICLPTITISSAPSFDNIGKSVSLLRGYLEDLCKKEVESISARVRHIQIATDEPTTRQEFLQYFHQLSLDPNTANKHLRLSQGNTVVTYSDRVQHYPEHPDRFACGPQVLCREGVCGKAYWEVEWSGNFCVYISVCYKTIDRKGDKDTFGCNDQSWTMINSLSRLLIKHNSVESEIVEPLYSTRIGVYVNHSAGTLSFYSVSDKMSLLERVHTTFTQPLYPGFRLLEGSSVRLVREI